MQQHLESFAPSIELGHLANGRVIFRESQTTNFCGTLVTHAGIRYRLRDRGNRFWRG
jgi:hypothetical protein